MDMDFIGWLKECYDSGELTLINIEDCLSDSYEAYRLYEDFISCDKHACGEEVQEQLKKLKKWIELRKKP